MSTALPLEQYRNQQDVDHHAAVDFGTGALNLLLMRMEALQLEPDAVRRIEPDAFSHLVEACAHGASKGSCKQDLASLGTATHGWEYYCRWWLCPGLKKGASATPNEPLIMTSASRGRMAADRNKSGS